MNRSPLTTFLLAVLVISALASVGLCYLCTRNSMYLVKMQQQVAFAQSQNAYIAALVKDVVDYSSKNPSIDPLLEAAGIHVSRATPAPSAAKPVAK